MKWPSRGKPELHKRGDWWVVRWYDPVIKRAQTFHTKDREIAEMFLNHRKGEHHA